MEAAPLIESSRVATELSCEELSDLFNKNSHIELKAYKRRWWVLAVFTYCSAIGGIGWATWLTISDTLLRAYDWNASSLAMSNSAYCISLVVMALPIMRIIEAKGMCNV